MVYGNTYEKDLRFIQKIDNLMSRKLELVAYYFGLGSCLVAHIMYLMVFYRNGIKEMAVFNVFSVLFYLGAVLVVRRVTNRINIVYFSLLEIMLHSSFATIYTGWTADFGMFLLMIIPIGFLMPKKKQRFAFLIMAVALVIYGSLRYAYFDSANAVYNLEHERVGVVLYFINIGVGAMVLAYCTSLYAVLNHYLQCKLRVQNEKLKIAATKDPLTMLNNRRAMNEEMKKIVANSIRQGKSYVCGLGDVDDFKRVNDTYGHDSGDEVLTEVARIIQENMPDGALAARWGGEEFLFVIPTSDLGKGTECAEQILQKIRELGFSKEDASFHVTMTIGVCEGSPGMPWEKVVSIADKCLYKGKNSGKNHVEAFAH